MKQKQKKLAYILAFLLAFTLLPAPFAAAAEESARDTVNVAVTNTINTLNPFLYDGTIVNTYAIGLQFLPLVELKNDMSFEGVIAEEITTEDNLTFTIKLREEAKWSDGEPVTSDDVLFTLVNLTSEGMGNLNTYIYSSFEGFNEGGQVKDGTKWEDIPSLERVDEKTLKMTASSPIPLNTFLNSYMRYINPVPAHVFRDQSIEEIRTSTWFMNPDVVSGPYRSTDAVLDQYVSYEANEEYWKGAPLIRKLNLKVVQGAQILLGLESGEIDFVQPTMATIPLLDQESVKEMEGVRAEVGKPLTNQLMFINNESIPEAKARQAILHAIDRAMLLNDFLSGAGETVDGFVSSFSPYFDKEMELIPYDMEKARELMEESGFDTAKELTFLVNSGDPFADTGVFMVVEQLKEIGLNINVKALDIGSLLAAVNKHEYDLMAVQYTFAPIDPLLDVAWLAGSSDGAENWSRYESEEMNELLAQASEVKDGDTDAMIEVFGQIDRLIQRDVPLLSLYVQSPMGAVRESLKNAEATAYGFFLNVQEWTFAD